MSKLKECRFGHVCTSGCQNDFDCPCQSEHCCEMTENCDGTCDNCYREIVLEKAIHRQNARDAKRKKLCLIDDSELLETQEYAPNFKGTHPWGEDPESLQRKKKWLKELQYSDPYAKLYEAVFWIVTGFFGTYLFIALLRIIFKQ